jgi:RNA polymerase sigma factor (sigma-70 family)
MTAQPPSDDDVVALLPPLRRVTAALGLDPATSEDIVQETVTRLLAERARMDRATLTSYAIVTARNAAASLRREEQLWSRHQHRLLEPPAAAPPDEDVLRREEHAALAAALAALPPRDRALLTARDVAGHTPAALARQAGISPPALAVRLSRARARLRVEYIIALRHIHLPTRRCRPVLLALSAGDRRRQSELQAGQHLLSCPTCAALAGPLLRRSRWLAGLIPWPGAAAVIKSLRRVFGQRPVHLAAAGATAAAGLAAVAVLTTSAHHPATAQHPAAQILTVAGRELTPAAARHLRRYAGKPAAAHGAPVVTVPAGEGFWVNDRGRVRVWVELIGRGESPQHVRPGDRVTFHGTVAVNPPHFAANAGIDADGGAGLLNREGAHINVRYRALQITHGTRRHSAGR